MFNARDLASQIDHVVACIGVNIVAAGAGDNTKVTGETIDRFAAYAGDTLGEVMSADLCVCARAVLAASKKLSIAIEIEEADNSSFTSSTTTVLQASTALLTDSGSGSTLRGSSRLAVDLFARKRYVRFNVTPDLDASGTDTAQIATAAALRRKAQP
jgi:hypothetical protein